MMRLFPWASVSFASLCPSRVSGRPPPGISAVGRPSWVIGLPQTAALPNRHGESARSWLALDRKSTRLNSSHRDLHSFPTDALPISTGNQRSWPTVVGNRAPTNCSSSKPTRRERSVMACTRSEEHTSELQSPRSTLFPYRRSSDLHRESAQLADRRG